jgi:hypothetical protein
MISPKVAVFLPVYNEEKYIRMTIDSLLVQDYPNLDLIVSENHSTDSTAEILAELQRKDARIQVIRPPEKLNSHGNLVFLTDFVSQGDYFASMMLGGHDLVSHNIVSIAVQHLLAHPGCAVAYQRSSYEMDEASNPTRRWGTCHASGHMNAAFDAVLTLITLMYNTPIFGLWRQSVRTLTAFRHPCVGGDHLYVAEAALHGSIDAIDGAQIYLRRSPPTANYLAKHFTDAAGDEAAAQDMMVQLSWLSDIVDRATVGHSPLSQELFRSSAFALYLLRYTHHFSTFQSNAYAFYERREIAPLLTKKVEIGQQIKALFHPSRPAAELGQQSVA